MLLSNVCPCPSTCQGREGGFHHACLWREFMNPKPTPTSSLVMLPHPPGILHSSIFEQVKLDSSSSRLGRRVQTQIDLLYTINVSVVHGTRSTHISPATNAIRKVVRLRGKSSRVLKEFRPPLSFSFCGPARILCKF